jgi:hypothetical protein
MTAMTKKLVAVPEGNLLRIATTKGVETLSALKEKTSVDRKTLRTINTGKPVKEITLQAIADKLRVPLADLLGPSTLVKAENSSSLAPYHRVSDGSHLREIKLQQLDAAALRRLAEEPDQITWLLKMDQMPESLEATLLKLRESLQGWHDRLATFGTLDLVDQISSIKTSADIDKSVEQLAKQNLKIHGSTYVFWDRTQPVDPYEGYLVPIRIYTSQTKMALSIAPEEKNNSTVQVATGWVPPQKFIASELAGIDSVEIDGREVWSREKSDECPF